MKKRYLKRWVEFVLIGIIFLAMLVLGGESDSFFIISKVIALAIMLPSIYILYKYSRY